MDVRVRCYAGHKADERPVRFALDAHEYVVIEVVDQWYGPEDDYFKVRANDGNLYILRRYRVVGAWSLEAFRKPR